MAIVVYKCDVCKRTREYQQNVDGMEKIQRCTITHGCRGKLFQLNVLPDYIRASRPDSVLGLDDWRQRKVLYNHIQTIARNTWIVKHNLGTFPSISVFVNIPIEGNPDNIEEILPDDTKVVDDDNIILTFNRSWSGLAQLVARQSDPNLLKPFTRIVDTSKEDLQQISKDGEIAIATRISSVGECENIELSTLYSTTQNTIVNHTYTQVNDNTTNSSSPWFDFDSVVIKGKIYTVRSFDGIIPQMFDETIGSGSTFRFTGITQDATCSPLGTSRNIQQDEVYILFASKPFEIVDKLTTQYIDVFDVTDSENIFSLIYDSGEFFSQKNIIQETYPPIRSV